MSKVPRVDSMASSGSDMGFASGKSRQRQAYLGSTEEEAVHSGAEFDANLDNYVSIDGQIDKYDIDLKATEVRQR